MSTLLVVSPDRDTGIERIKPNIEVGINPDDSTPIDILNPADRAFTFTTEGISCRVVLEENSTIFNAPRKDDDPFHEPVGEGVTRLTLSGVLPITVEYPKPPIYNRPFYQFHFWRKNQNKVQLYSPLSQLDIPEQGWTIDRITTNLEQSPYILNWRIVLSGGIRVVAPRG